MRRDTGGAGCVGRVAAEDKDTEGRGADDNDGDRGLDAGPELDPDGTRRRLLGVGDDDADDGEDDDEDAQANDTADHELLLGRLAHDEDELPGQDHDEQIRGNVKGGTHAQTELLVLDVLGLGTLAEGEVVGDVAATDEGKVNHDGNVGEQDQGRHAPPEATIPGQTVAQWVEEGEEGGLDGPETGPEDHHGREALAQKELGLDDHGESLGLGRWRRQEAGRHVHEEEHLVGAIGVETGERQEQDRGNGDEIVVEHDAPGVLDAHIGASDDKERRDAGHGPDDRLDAPCQLTLGAEVMGIIKDSFRQSLTRKPVSLI